MIKVIGKDILSISNALNILRAYKKITMVNSVKVGRTLNIVNKEVELILEKQAECLKKYAKKDDEGNFKTKDLGNNGTAYIFEDRLAYDEEMKEFSNAEIEINVSPLDIAIFKDKKNKQETDLPPIVFEQLHWLFNFEDIEEQEE